MTELDRPIRVMLVDDQALVRSGFAMVLSVEEDIEVVGQAANGRDALAVLAEHPADVVLMDVQMPVMDGIAATHEVVAQGWGKVIILTTFDREDYLFDALAAGASGFLLKNADPDDLVDAVRAVAQGHALLAPEATLRVIAKLVGTGAADDGGPAGRPASGAHAVGYPGVAKPGRSADVAGAAAGHGDPVAGHGGPTAGVAGAAGAAAEDVLPRELARAVDALTPREREVLTLLAEGLSNGEIAGRLFLGEATVKTHVSNILTKTDSRDRVQAVIFAYRTGLATPR